MRQLQPSKRGPGWSLKPIPGRETCALCYFGFPLRELQEIEHDGRRVKACRACRAKIVQERPRRERDEIQGGQMMW